jgi:hypothetical protein
MPVKKIITTTIPNLHTSHFFQMPESEPIHSVITELSRQYFSSGKILRIEKVKTPLTVKTVVTWLTREDCDESDEILHGTFPEYKQQRDDYHASNNIFWSISYEDVSDEEAGIA